MAYDSKLDKSLFSKSWEKEGDGKEQFGTKLTVSVFSYNNGVAKLQISRQNENADGEYIFSKLGRMLKDEVEAIVPLIQEALKKFPKQEENKATKKEKTDPF